MTTQVTVKLEDLLKSELLRVLEHTPQHFWPPRPTRQSRNELLRSIRSAIAADRYTFTTEHLQ